MRSFTTLGSPTLGGNGVSSSDRRSGTSPSPLCLIDRQSEQTNQARRDAGRFRNRRRAAAATTTGQTQIVKAEIVPCHLWGCVDILNRQGDRSRRRRRIRKGPQVPVSGGIEHGIRGACRTPIHEKLENGRIAAVGSVVSVGDRS